MRSSLALFALFASFAFLPSALIAQDLQIAGKIAFQSNRNGNHEIYAMNADKTGLTNLTNNLAADFNTTWSPDGTKVAFQSNREGNWEIYVMNADGTGSPINLTNHSANDEDPSWSPEGTKIVFRSNRDGNNEIYVINADGTGTPARLTHHPANDGWPRWSPDGTKIVFFSDRDGDREIYVMDSNGDNETQLTHNTAIDEYPSWSPDGTKIAFGSNRDGNREIYVMSSDGTGTPVRLTDNSVDDNIPTWSPDGTKIAFYTDRDGNAEIYAMNLDGTGQTNLTNNPASDDSPSWAQFRRIGATAGGSVSRMMTIENRGSATLNVSNITSSDGQFTVSPTNFSVNAGASQNVTAMFTPTSAGTKYATLTITSNDPQDPTVKLVVNGTATAVAAPIFAFSTGTLAANTKIGFYSQRDGNSEIYTMNGDGSNQTRLTNNAAAEMGAVWSPDGSKIAFQTDRDGNHEIYVMNANGTGQSRLTNNGTVDGQPSWSPDGTKIAFLSERDGNNEIYLMNADGTGQTRLTNNAAADRWPRWSPDGTKIVFFSERDGDREVYVMNADGTDPTRLTNNPGLDEYPAFSPDGAKIAFTSQRDGNREIYVMNADGTNPSRITNNGSDENFPAWSPDGTKFVFYSDRDSNPELYSMNTDGSGQTRLTNSAGSDDAPSWSLFFRALDAGAVSVGSSGNATFTVTNRGNATLNISGMSLSGADASQFNAPSAGFSLAPGASHVVTVMFSPTSAGPKSASLSIAHNAGGSPAIVSLSGTGQGPANRPPDCSQAMSSVASLWPPNHKMANITILGVTDPDGDFVTITITKITQDEPLNGTGDGDTAPDGAGVGTSTAQVRAERAGSKKAPGNGRVYEISFTADDGKGGMCNGSVRVCVPHDQGKGSACIDDGQNYNSTASSKPVATEFTPEAFSLDQNYPNPFNPLTIIRYALPEASEVRLVIYNVLGQQVRALAQGRQEAGYYRVTWDGRDDAGRPVSSGLYLYRFESKGLVKTEKMLLLK